MPESNATYLSAKDRAAIVAQHLWVAERSAFEAELNLATEIAALDALGIDDEAERGQRLGAIKGQADHAAARLAALRQRPELADVNPSPGGTPPPAAPSFDAEAP